MFSTCGNGGTSCSSIEVEEGHKLTNINKTKILFRARVYNEIDAREKYCLQFENATQTSFKGYPKEKCGSPPCKLCLDDKRCSPKYISYLYLSDSLDTCISEISPSIGEHINVAEFSPMRELRLLNLDLEENLVNDATIEKIWLMDLAWRIKEAFASPVGKNDRGLYILCQYISKCIKTKKYDTSK